MVLLGAIQGSASPLSKYLWRGTNAPQSSCIPILYKTKTKQFIFQKIRLITSISWDTTPLAAKPQLCSWAYEKAKFHFLQVLHYWMSLSFFLHWPKTKRNLPTASDRAKVATGLDLNWKRSELDWSFNSACRYHLQSLNQVFLTEDTILQTSQRI